MVKTQLPAHDEARAADAGASEDIAIARPVARGRPDEAGRAGASERDGGAGTQQRGGRRKPADSRSTAEWVTLAISLLIVGALVALTSYFYLTESAAPASMEAEPRLAETFQSGSRFSVPVVVRNQGGATGEDVKVRVTLTDPEGRQETAEWQIAFLSGGGMSHGVAVFGTDPRQGQLEAGVVSYLEP
jgi:uncharacterized protein (TIGR02588 family)